MTARSRPSSSNAEQDNEPTPTPTEDFATGLEATADEFYSRLQVAYETNETREFWKLVGEGCVACERYRDSIHSYGRRGQHNERVTYQVADFEVVDDNERFPVATFRVTTTKGRIVDAEGNSVKQIEPVRTEVTMDFVRVDGTWLVQEQSLD